MNIKKGFFYLLILAPPVYILSLINLYDVIVPYWDAWALVRPLEKVQTGTLSLSDLYAQHNEHRILFPRVIMLILAGLSGWNLFYELYTNVVIAALTMLFLYAILRRSLSGRTTHWHLVALSFLVFSPSQWENWSWGWQLQIFLNVLAIVIAVWTASRWPGKTVGLLAAIAAAVLATYSFSNGLAAWVVVGVMMLFQKEWRRVHIAVWSAVFLLIVVLYFYGFKQVPGHPSFTVPLEHPYDYSRYILAYIGSPLSSGFLSPVVSLRDTAIGIGLLLVALLVKGSVWLWRNDRDGFEKLLPWLALALYVFFSGAITGIGRLGFGISQALSSKYITISFLFTFSTLVAVILWVESYVRINGRLSKRMQGAMYSLSMVLALSFAFSSVKGLDGYKWRVKEIEHASVCLEDIDLADDACFGKIFPNIEHLKRVAKKFLNLGLLNTKRPHWPDLKLVDGGLAVIRWVNKRWYSSYGEGPFVMPAEEKMLHIIGWAVDDKAGTSGGRVYLVFRSDGEEITVPTVRSKSLDLMDLRGEEGYRFSGWEYKFKTDRFTDGCYRLYVRIIRANWKEYFEQDMKKSFCF